MSRYQPRVIPSTPHNYASCSQELQRDYLLSTHGHKQRLHIAEQTKEDMQLEGLENKPMMTADAEEQSPEDGVNNPPPGETPPAIEGQEPAACRFEDGEFVSARGMELGDEEVQELCTLLAGSEICRELDAGDNQIGNGGFGVLVEAVVPHPMLTVLDLSKNRVASVPLRAAALTRTVRSTATPALTCIDW
eukprot:TRINITY_DN8049_c0_g2_i1.p1 TRINITY_DN8049_c0_g2~~TRINITY_DN8049_c0_g2_i1.p1  ORF type:complete len:191 (-),score=48.09 TRINITY_DN8049_c0_g2_i1:691-1263(-)